MSSADVTVLSHGRGDESPWASARSEKTDPVVIRENVRKSFTGRADSQREGGPQLQVSDRLGTLPPHGPEFTAAKVLETSSSRNEAEEIPILGRETHLGGLWRCPDKKVQNPLPKFEALCPIGQGILGAYDLSSGRSELESAVW